ncbi:hypothetical protein QWY77_08255 [Thalassotalea ponticola]|uniref:hypothetical protein n=1 Tax=Thalassotalea ponticola TaxID=1523392 RepID=UPI0025B37F9E|nr:hypothetical protein [Thalassotalea ponticola]MDN3652756.1 hypothetical protein [Thalassotalea ponticola]
MELSEINKMQYRRKLTLGEYVRLINRVNRSWKYAQSQWGRDSLIALKLRELKPILQIELLTNHPELTYLAYDDINSRPDYPLLGIKLREKIIMDNDELKKAYYEYIEGSKDDADHLPWARAKKALSASQIKKYFEGEIQDFMKEYLK